MSALSPRSATDYARPARVLLADDESIIAETLSRSTMRMWRDFVVRVVGNDLLPTLRRAAAIFNDPKNFADGRLPVWWLGVGTALGYLRDQRLLAHDSDIDIRVGLPYQGNAAAIDAALALARLLYQHDFVPAREVYFDGRPMQVAFADLKNHGAILDIYFFYSGISEGRYVNVNAETMRRKPAHLVDNRRQVHWPGYPGIRVYVPHPLKDYAVWRFGPEWRVPKKNSELGPIDTACFEPVPQVTVLTYGTWDLFHHGHLSMLERVAALGDHVVVGVVSDEVCRIRGKQPAQSETERADRVRELPFVNEVFLQRQLDQKEADIERFGAAHLVIGDDWKDHPRYEQVRDYRGVQIHYLPRTPGISSTQLREQVAASRARDK